MSIANLTKFDPARNRFTFDAPLQSGILSNIPEKEVEDLGLVNSTFQPFPFPGLPGGTPPPLFPDASPVPGGGGPGGLNAQRAALGNAEGYETFGDLVSDVTSGFGFFKKPDPFATAYTGLDDININNEEEDGFSFDGIMNAFKNLSPVNFALRNIVSPVVDKINTAYDNYKANKMKKEIPKPTVSSQVMANKNVAMHDKLKEAFGGSDSGGYSPSPGTTGKGGTIGGGSQPQGPFGKGGGGGNGNKNGNSGNSGKGTTGGMGPGAAGAAGKGKGNGLA